jgi:hypothetical protein
MGERIMLQPLHRRQVLALAVLMSVAFTSFATPSSIPDLEKAFWRCDYFATTHGFHVVPHELCTTVTDALKAQRFGGDFDELVRWWAENKSAEHLRVRAEDGRASCDTDLAMQ